MRRGLGACLGGTVIGGRRDRMVMVMLMGSNGLRRLDAVRVVFV
jgi:hypothetical protein